MINKLLSMVGGHQALIKPLLEAHLVSEVCALVLGGLSGEHAFATPLRLREEEGPPGESEPQRVGQGERCRKQVTGSN